MNRQVPWLRVFVEGVVIVGSILLAFGIQAWWDGVQEREREAGYLTALHEEFQAVLIEIDDDYGRRGTRTEAYAWILSAISSGRAVADDSLSARLGLMPGMARFLPPHGVYDDFVASGSLRSLDPDLRAVLLSYGEQSDRLRWAEERQNAAYFEGVYPYLLEHVDWLATGERNQNGAVYYPTTHDSGFVALMADREFQNLLVSRLRDLAFSQNSTRRLREIVLESLRLLEARVE